MRTAPIFNCSFSEDFNTQHQAMIGMWERQMGDDFERKSVDATIAIMTQVGGNA